MTRAQKWVAHIAVIVFSAVFGQSVGCALFQDTVKDPSVQKLVDKCMTEGRAAMIDGATPDGIKQVFDDCISRGLPDAGR